VGTYKYMHETADGGCYGTLPEPHRNIDGMLQKAMSTIYN